VISLNFFVFDGNIYANINKTQHNGMGVIAHYFYCIDSASHVSENATWPHDRENSAFVVWRNNGCSLQQ